MNNHRITLQQAIEMTTLYRANKPASAPLCETFDVQAINDLFAFTGCKSLRIYYGMKENLQIDLILVAVDSNGKDILPTASESLRAQSGQPLILEDGYRCPPDCPPKSPLNSN